MKGTSVLLDHLAGRQVAARLHDGRLDDLLVASSTHVTPGTIFRAVVDRPVKGQGGVFVRLADGLDGFLRPSRGLAPGQRLLVQVTSYSEPGKAIPVTARLLFKSKYAIVTPGAPGVNVSRAIRDHARRAGLQALAAAQVRQQGTGLILRSLAADAEDAEVAEDIDAMLALADAIGAETSGDPDCLLDGPDPHALAWRDWGNPDEVEIAPGCLTHRGVTDDIAALAHPAHALRGGGHLILEPTRALVACDVNSGSDFSPAAALKANLEALRSLPRALRLRGLGGQVVVDLAPLAKRDRRQAEQVLKAALKVDPIETSFVGWTPLGHIELQRKRERPPLERAFLEAVS